MSEVPRLHESFAHEQTALGQYVTDRKQLREILDQVQRAYEKSSTELARLLEQMNRLSLIDSVDKRLRKVEYNLSRLDGQVELLTKMQLAGTTSLLQAQAPSGPREKGHDMAQALQLKHWVCAQLARKIECIGNALLRERPDEARTQLCLGNDRHYICG